MPDPATPSAATGGAPQDPREDEWLSDETVRQVAQREPLTVPVRLAREVQHHREVRAKGQGPAAGPSEPQVAEAPDGQRYEVISWWTQDGATPPHGEFNATLRPLSGPADTPEEGE